MGLHVSPETVQRLAEWLGSNGNMFKDTQQCT
jgi:hypothetical protein